MRLDEYAAFDGIELARLVRRREISAAELATTASRAIELANPLVNAVIETYAPTDFAAPGDMPFCGVPFLLKDIGSHDAGVKFELGSRLAEGLLAPPHASELVRRFRASGVTVMGRTNIPEMGSSCTTEPALYGPTRNPWNLERTSGGSSGGAAAAVASGMVPIAHANDAGGSIRWPAACCGLVGLKPSRNLNPVGPDEALALNGLAAEHIVSRSVRDTAAMLDHTAGPDTGAWCYTERLDGSYLEHSTRPPRPLRIALDLDPKFPPTKLDQSVVAAARDAASLCQSLGHHVEEASPSFDTEAMLEAFSLIWSTSLRGGVEAVAKLTGRPIDNSTLEPHVLAAWRDAAEVSGVKLNWALGQMNDVARAYGRLFSRYDILLTPAGAMEPFEIGRIGQIPAERFFDWFMQMCAHCPFLSSVNIAGIPAMSLPLGWSRNGLPIGSHFVAPLGQELRLLRLATQLEEAKPWRDRIPPVHVSTL